ncbi:MAG TPA: two-component system response regulator [Ruminiclostridium sp.]|nr:two-component system response regulator [Ruminiclostridium sp.]
MIHTILVIDDCTLDNAILRNILSNEYYNTISALNGRDALDLVESRNVDVILLDMSMPIMDGPGFLQEFKKTVYYKTIPIIIVTSTDKTGIIEETAKEYDIFDYILKPFDKIKNLESVNYLIFVNKIRSALRYRMAIKSLAELRNTDGTDGH